MHETIIITAKNNFKEYRKNIFEENYYSLVSYIHTYKSNKLFEYRHIVHYRCLCNYANDTVIFVESQVICYNNLI